MLATYGWVHTVVYYGSEDNVHYLLKAMVNPSQCLSDKPHNPWVAVDKETGTDITGHFTCMVGQAENVVLSLNLMYVLD